MVPGMTPAVADATSEQSDDVLIRQVLAGNTAVFELDRQVTERVRSEFIGRGKWTIVPETTGVDGLLTGVITSVTLTPVAFNQSQQATRYALMLSASVECSCCGGTGSSGPTAPSPRRAARSGGRTPPGYGRSPHPR